TQRAKLGLGRAYPRPGHWQNPTRTLRGMSQRSAKPRRYRGAAPHPRGADPGARWQTLCDIDRNGAGARDSLTPDHKSTTAQFLSGFDEFAAGSEALVLRRSERTDTARGVRQLCFSKNAALR